MKVQMKDVASISNLHNLMNGDSDSCRQEVPEEKWPWETIS